MPAAATRSPRVTGLVAWVVLLVVATALLTTWSDPRLTTPAVTEPAAWSTWIAATDPAMMAMAVLRLLLVALTWYLLVATTIQVLARLTTSLHLVRLANALSIPPVRRVVGAGLGMGLAATMVTAVSVQAPHGGRGLATAAAAASPTTPPTARADETAHPTMHRHGVAATPVMHRAPAIPSMHRAPPAPTMAHGRVATSAPTDAQTEQRGDRRGPRDHASTWVVRTGDHLWNVAERALADHFGSTPSDARVVAYWQRLIETNRSRLPDPANPDLVLPGLELRLPDAGTEA